ncbi:Suclg2 protein [Salpingoeca rosetta]|uniref:Succinate-CoA ligase subunit beta n=1 Tax=Salpingoeca rosetta (strain ATCC 50818 / BSB-021) TaxID=946362 RepID=F2U1Q7_SALR5|nr:Suclg2 protein [Salpingoeca rosetta]EGD81559.1 Suclg2 protein [Salpingoeca rosetta]|eukprot:XP_004996763.1 Suclg2 protein [Salpingoeca rosetta]
MMMLRGHRACRSLARQVTQVRQLNLHEYQSKGLMQKHGVTVQRFRFAETPEQAEEGARDLAAREYVLKAQVHAGGRGKGTFSSGLQGGVKLTTDPKQVKEYASQMLGYKLVTKQTPPDGVLVSKLMVAEALDIARETYFAILMDRDSNGPVMVASPEGGVDIEEVAAKTPELIFKEPIDIVKGVTEEQLDRLAINLRFEGQQFHDAKEQMRKLYELFLAVDATQVEINPFAETPDGQVVCFDAKINFDDNAAFRQQEIFAMRDTTEEDPRDVEADKHGLNYIGMDGNIACLVNGAGLAMATMDIIKLHGGEPANFLDCGGGVTEDMVTSAFKLLTGDKQVEAILVNIFGGIVNCATIANGIVSACKNVELQVPLVVRLEGTNVEKARQVLKESGLPIITATDLDDAAKRAVEAAAHARAQ